MFPLASLLDAWIRAIMRNTLGYSASIASVARRMDGTRASTMINVVIALFSTAHCNPTNSASHPIISAPRAGPPIVTHTL